MRKGEIRKIKKLRREGRYLDNIPVPGKSEHGVGFNVYLWAISIACGAFGGWASLIHLRTVIPFETIASVTCFGGIVGLMLLYKLIHRHERTVWGAAFISI